MSQIKIAAAYIRVSTDDQTEFSPAAQLRELREYAAAHNLILDERYIYADEGISGRKAEKRPGFMAMIEAAKQKDHPFEVVLVHKFDRFARSREDSIVYKSMLKRAGVEVISIKEPLTEGSYAGVMEAIYESFAEAYSINLGQEVRKGMKEKALRGEPQTAPPFGYRLENKAFVPHDTEAPIIRQIFERFSAGEGLFPIAKWLNAQGITTHRGNAFENRTVEYILRNPVYIGYTRWNPNGRTRRDYNNPDILTAKGQHTPIIDQELWDAVQTRMAEVKARHRYHGRPSYDRKHWLCGIIRCATCGATLVFYKPNYLKCNNYVRGRCTTSQHTPIPAMEEAFLNQLRADMDPAQTPACTLVRTSSPANDPIHQLRQALEKAERKKDRLTEAYLAEALSLEDYKNLSAKLTQEIQALQASLQEAQATQAPIDTKALLRQAIASVLDTLTSPDATIAQKYEAASSIVSSAIYDKSANTLTLTYRTTV